MRFSYWFSRRLRLGKSASNSSATGTVIAVAGVSLSIVVMMLSLAIVSGFKNEIEQKVLGFDNAITILPSYNYDLGESSPYIIFDDSLSNSLGNIIPEGKLVETSRHHAILKTDSDFIAVQCIAYGEGHSWVFEQNNLVSGNFKPVDDNIVISSTMANMLGIDLNNRPFLYFFVNGQPKARRATIDGIYNSNFGDYDKSVVYVSLSMLQGLESESNAVTGIAIENVGENIEEIVAKSESVQQSLVNSYRKGEIDAIYPVTNVTEQGAIFFSWLGLLDTNVVVIIVLMSFVAAFTLISSLFIMILDRISTIGILRSLGLSKARVSRIFVLVAMKIVGLGMLIGNIVGIGIILIQSHTHIFPMDPEMYYLDSVPFNISWQSILLLNICVAVGSWLILILPSRLAARIDPASTMRFE